MKYRNLLFYILTIGGCCLAMYFIVQQGAHLDAGSAEQAAAPDAEGSWAHFVETYRHNLVHPLAVLLLQIITIIVMARVFGFFCRKIGQPTVIGEILAGIFLGPSFTGTYLPEFSHFLFPPQSLANLQFLSQIGLILFMFVVGMELDLKSLKNKAQQAIVISHASIVFPFTLGFGLALYIYKNFAGENIPFLSFALFIGIAMSITAFPVLARIVQERGLSKTQLGAIVITCAAADDITAWCCLAAVIAVVKAGSFTIGLYTIALAVLYVGFFLKIVRPFLKRLGDIYASREGMSKPVVAIFFIILLLSSFTTEVIGIHALFGAFMAGVIMPPNQRFRNIFIEKVEDVALVLLLPLFFVFTGLRTQIGLLNDPWLWQVCALIIAVAITGKFAASALAARFVGQSWKDSLTIGALMNTRGLMELIVLNIGYDLGILSPQIFAMMVIMALVTTFMTGPALDFINYLFAKKLPALIASPTEQFRIIISFANPERGRAMLRLADSFTPKNPEEPSVTALHITSSNELNQFNTDEVEQENFQPIQAEAAKLQLGIVTLFRPSLDIEREIADTVNFGNYNLLLMGIGNSVFEGTLLGKILGFTTRIISPERIFDTLSGREKLLQSPAFDDRTRQIIRSVKIPVGVLIDRGLMEVSSVFIPIYSQNDLFVLGYAQKLMLHSGAKVTLLDANQSTVQADFKNAIRLLRNEFPAQFAVSRMTTPDFDFLQAQDLLLISLKSWKKVLEAHAEWLKGTKSVLIIKPVQ